MTIIGATLWGVMSTIVRVNSATNPCTQPKIELGFLELLTLGVARLALFCTSVLY